LSRIPSGSRPSSEILLSIEGYAATWKTIDDNLPNGKSDYRRHDFEVKQAITMIQLQKD
jgi:hypothetical protein